MSMSDSAEYWWAVKSGNSRREPMTPELRNLIKAKKELKKKFPELSNRDRTRVVQAVDYDIERVLRLDINEINKLLNKEKSA